MVKNIVSVEQSKDGSRTYATDSKGLPMFGRTPSVTALLKAGAYANVIEETQRMTRNEAGELVDLDPSDYRKNLIITAVFPTREAAIVANTEEALFEQESVAYLASQKGEISKKYKLDAATLVAAI